jgi:transaldolase
MEKLQDKSFTNFLHQTNLVNGLVIDRSAADWPASIAATETRVAQGKPVKHLALVASFFLGRIDALVDPLLEELIAQGGTTEADLVKKARGQAAIASAKMAYQIYKKTFGSDRFRKLAGQGDRVQRLLWTSTKNLDYSDVKYVEGLIGPDTVNTAPLETIDAYRDHGEPKARIEQDVRNARWVLERLPEVGISIDKVTGQLEDEGVKKFKKPYKNKFLGEVLCESQRV